MGLGFWFGISRFCQKKNVRIQYRSIHCILYSYIYFKMTFYPPKIAKHYSFFQHFINVLTVCYDIFISYLFIFRLLLPIFASTNLTSTSHKYTFLLTNPWSHQKKIWSIWKFQRYALIIDFEERLNLPPPFIIFSYICILLKKIYNKMKGCKRNCCTFCCCSKKAKVCGLISLSMYSCIYSFSHVVNLCFMSRRSIRSRISNYRGVIKVKGKSAKRIEF